MTHPISMAQILLVSMSMSVAIPTLAPAIDPAAVALLNQSKETYQKLTAFSATAANKDQISKIEWQKPNKCRFETFVPRVTVDESGKPTNKPTLDASDKSTPAMWP